MDNYCSPQWVDFTSTPDVPSDDYFEKNHEIYEYKECVKVPKITVTSENELHIEEVSKTETNNEKLETELNIMKNTPIKIIYPPSSLRSSKKSKTIKKITYDDILHEAIEVFEHCASAKLNIFEKPVPIKNDTADNKQVNNLPHIEIQQDTDGKPDQKIKSLLSTNSCNSDTSSSNLTKDNEFNLKSSIDNPVSCTPVNSTKSLRPKIYSKQGPCVSIENNSGCSSKQSKPVTYHCRRQSLIFRRSSNKFISLASTVRKIQHKTPEQFHNKCNKNLKVKAASANRSSSETRKNIFTKPNIKRRSVPVLSQKEEKDQMPDKVKELTSDKTSPKHITETPNAIKPRRSHLAHNKHVVSTIVGNNGKEIILKKEKILFFDIPIDTKRKKTTRPVPFSFDNRDKPKKQSSLRSSKEKSECQKIETTQTKQDTNKNKRECSIKNNINTDTDIQENKCPNVNADSNNRSLNRTKTMKLKSTTIGMNSYERGKQRRKYDEKIKQKIQMEEEMRQRMEADELAQEKLQIAMFRKQLEIKAKPVPTNKPFAPIKSTKPLTEPQSPAWAYKKKTKSST